jgi:hypothetical protein
VTKLMLAAAGTLLLAGCANMPPTAQELYGSGPVPNKKFVEDGIKEYLSQGAPGYFFLAEDGSTYGYSYCPISGGGCVGPEMRIAQDACRENARGARCFIYARDQRIVWDESLPPHPRTSQTP